MPLQRVIPDRGAAREYLLRLNRFYYCNNSLFRHQFVVLLNESHLIDLINEYFAKVCVSLLSVGWDYQAMSADSESQTTL